MLIENFDSADDRVTATDSSNNGSADIHAGASVSEEDIAATKQRGSVQKTWKKKNKSLTTFWQMHMSFHAGSGRERVLRRNIIEKWKGQASRGNCRLSDTDSQSSFLTMDVTRLTRFCRCHTFFSSLAMEHLTMSCVSATDTDATNGLLKQLKLTDFKVSGGFHVVPNAEDKARFSALAEMASIMNDIFVNCCLSYMPLTKATLDSAVKASARLLSLEQ